MFKTHWQKLACLSLALTLTACSGAPLAPPSVTSAAPGAGTARLQIAWPARQALAIPESTTDIHIVATDDAGKTLAEVSVVRGTTQVQLPQAGKPRLPAGSVTFSAEALNGSNVVLARASQRVAIDESGPTTVQLTFVAVTRSGGGSSAVVPAPTLTALSPNSGVATGGTSVTITGTNLTGASAVSFGGTPATSFTVVSATELSAVAPAHAAGAANVVVTTPGGTATATGGYTYNAVTPAPTITAIAPNNGSAAGGTSVTITGTNLTGVSAVSFGGTAATSFTVDSATQLTATAPAHAAGAVDVVVTTSGGTATATGGYTYNAVSAAPTITSFSPTTYNSFAPTVIIEGTGFTGVTSVTFGSTAATVLSGATDTWLQVTPPSGLTGMVDIHVTTPQGTATSASQFMYPGGGGDPCISDPFAPGCPI